MIIRLILYFALAIFSSQLWSISPQLANCYQYDANVEVGCDNKYIYDEGDNLSSDRDQWIIVQKEKTQGGSFFAFDVGLVATNSGSKKKIDGIIDGIEKNNFKVKVNPRNKGTKQEGNVTIDFGDKSKVNLRVETHPLKQNGPPVRHGNVEVTRQIKNKSKVVSNKHIKD